jgi:hypothetical protein
LTVWKSFSTAPPIQKSSRTANSINHSSHNINKSSQENHLNKVVKNATSDDPYPSWPKHRSPVSQSQARMINAPQRLASCQSSMKVGSQKQNA